MNEIAERQNPMVVMAMQKAVAEVQARVTLAAAAEPRDWKAIEAEMLKAVDSPRLADEGVWEYPKGGQNLSGLSIRMLEEVLSRAGHYDWGVITLSQDDQGSYMQAFAMDIQRNNRVSKDIYVPHERKTRYKTTHLTDAREVYEHTSNMVTRRMRSCMEAVIPKDLRDELLEAADKRIADEAKLTPEGVKKMVSAFSELGVTKEMLTGWLGYPMDKITPRRYVRLRRIYRSIKDGYATPGDWFKGASSARVVDERLKTVETPSEGTGSEEIVPESEPQTVNAQELRDRQPEGRSESVEDDWLDAATGDVK